MVLKKVTNMEENIKISIVMLTYNQKKYVKKAIDSVLMQKTEYTYELLIGDDYSTDGTRDVLLQYKTNPNIRLFLHKKNLGATKNGYYLFKKIRGEYFVTLDGDDYWKNEDVLNSNVKFLEKRREYIGVGTKIEVVNEHGRYIRDIMPPEYYNREFTLNDYLEGRSLQFRAVLWRNVFSKIGYEELKILYYAHNILGDFTLNLLFLEQGKIYILDDVMQCYRAVAKKNGSNYNSMRTYYQKYENHMQVIMALKKYHKPLHDYDKIIQIRTVNVIKDILGKKDFYLILKIIENIGIMNFALSVRHYNKYKDWVNG
jgi:glycosyltransferase involved in cell wall biosynthesis